MKKNRLFLLAALASVPLGLLIYATCIEPVWLRVRTVPFEVSRAQGRTLRVVHLTDLHWGRSSPRYLERVFREAAARRPDLIVLTGDYMRRTLSPEDRVHFSRLLKILSNAAPTYAVPGNHDGGLWASRDGGYADTKVIRRVLFEGGIRYLENEYSCPIVRDARVCVGGLGDPWAAAFRPEAFMPDFEREPADLRILLVHNPDTKQALKDSRWDLMLAGHTHGGQVRFPLIGSPWAPVRDRSHLKGLARFEGHWIHVSPGTGMSGAHARFGVRPELSVLEVGI